MLPAPIQGGAVAARQCLLHICSEKQAK